MNRDNPQQANARIVRRLLFVVVGMFGFGFAMVPLYNVFCDITGLNGKTNSSAATVQDLQVDEDRTVTVEFLASVNENLAWDFASQVAKLQVHPGKPYTVSYSARNRADHAVVGHAVPSVAPGSAAEHFRKTECFCFTDQLFQPGERRDMPVTFVIDPDLPEKVEVVTLSYTFFDTGKLATVVTPPGLEAIGPVPEEAQ
jgi:cytochrome c oxidase assembly protein subunit 11